MERTNALAELAKRLTQHLDDGRTVTETVSIWNDFLNAQRIIAKLAKVKDDETHTASQMAKMTNDALAQELRDLKMSDYVEIPMADFALLEEAAIRLDKLDSYEKATEVKGGANV